MHVVDCHSINLKILIIRKSTYSFPASLQKKFSLSPKSIFVGTKSNSMNKKTGFQVLEFQRNKIWSEDLPQSVKHGEDTNANLMMAGGADSIQQLYINEINTAVV